jgi:hypothetical protein
MALAQAGETVIGPVILSPFVMQDIEVKCSRIDSTNHLIPMRIAHPDRSGSIIEIDRYRQYP